MKRNHSSNGRNVGEALVLLTMILMTALPLAAQQTPPTEVGIYGAYQIVQHDATIEGMPGVPCCAPEFDGGTGSGYTLGGLYRMPLAPRFGLDFRLGYLYYGGGLVTEEDIGNAMEGGETVDAMSEHTIDVELEMLSFEPRLGYSPFDGVPVTFNLGMQLSYFNFGVAGERSILAAEFTQNERLLTPTGATFLDGTTTRNQQAGQIPGERDRILVGGIVGARYDFPIAPRFTVSPEVAYHYNFSSIMEDADWKPHALRLGATFTYSIGTERSIVSPETLPNLPLAAAVAATGLYADSSEREIVEVRVEEFLGAQLRPLLNYVFFDRTGAALPPRYNRLTPDGARAFQITDLNRHSTLETYHNLLNIVGRRMVENPQARIRLVGTNDGKEVGAANQVLSRSRATSVRDYLRDAWGIAPERMTIETRALPEKPSNGETNEGDEENRRVEIIPDDWRITEPVLVSDTTRSADPPAIRFRTSARADAGMASWKLVSSQSGRPIREISGNGEVPPTIDWQFDQRSMPSIPVPIDYTLQVTDRNGQSYSTPLATIQTNQVTVQKKRRDRIADREIGRYSLILFDFDSPAITESNRRIVDMIRNRITLASDVAITGYTDRLGDSEHNEKLARQRADATASALGIARAEVSGVGESNHYDNSLPEGRFYCRTVEVEVSTPIED